MCVLRFNSTEGVGERKTRMQNQKPTCICRCTHVYCRGTVAMTSFAQRREGSPSPSLSVQLTHLPLPKRQAREGLCVETWPTKSGVHTPCTPAHNGVFTQCSYSVHTAGSADPAMRDARSGSYLTELSANTGGDIRSVPAVGSRAAREPR